MPTSCTKADGPAPVISLMTAQDITALEQAALLVHGDSPVDYFQHCYEEQNQNRRYVLVARLALEQDTTDVAGYAMVNFHPLYAPFRHMGIPEIQDLSVVPGLRKQGLGRALITACEDSARAKGCTQIGIGVGLGASFGAAQRLYVRAGFIPDGAGACFDNTPMRTGDLRPFGDAMTLKLIKDL